MRAWEFTPEGRSYLEANDYFQGSEGKIKDTNRAIEIWTELAENGHVPSQCFLGYVYQKGYNPFQQEDQKVEIDYDKAWSWAIMAAQGGCSIAVYQVGMWYKNAPESEENRQKAIYWLNIMADKNGYHNAQYHLGILYLDHKLDKAKYWLTRAANQGHKEAINQITKLNPDYQPLDANDIVYETGASKHSSDILETTSDLMAILLIAMLNDDKKTLRAQKVYKQARQEIVEKKKKGLAKPMEEECLQEQKKYDRVRCIGYEGSLAQAYMSLYFTYVEPNPDEAWDYVRLEALSNIDINPNKNQIRLQALKKAKLEKPDFIKLYEKAILWAEKEAEQSADELYARSKTIVDELSRESLIESFQKVYLYMAKGKGHEQARIEVEIMSEEFLRRMEKKYSK